MLSIDANIGVLLPANGTEILIYFNLYKKTT